MRSPLTRLVWVLAAPAALMTVSACGLVLGLEDGVYVDGGINATDSGDAAVADGREPPKDAISVEANFATCDGAPSIVADAIYVSMSGTDGDQCGGAGTPCKTIGKAVIRAAGTSSKTIYVGHGSYDEQVVINSPTEDGTVIQGGFDDYPDAAWIPNCDQQKVTIKSNTKNYSVLIDGRSATLRLVHVESRDQAPDDESVYAVVVNGGSLTLDNALLVAQNAGRGTDGTPGIQGMGCDLGGDGKNGAAGKPGSFSAVGFDFIPSTAGNGDPGEAGAGAFGGVGACDFNCGSRSYMSILAGDAAPPDSGGFDAGFDGGLGDGGGDGGVCNFFLFGNQTCAEDGGFGCGGSGGSGGGGGKGGGASIALYIAGKSKVTLVGGVSLNTANGGNGGNGGLGGSGAMGQVGNAGADITCDLSCMMSKVLKGGMGGTGAPGGVGGTGGGGAGGPTYLFVSPDLSYVDALLAPNWASNSMLGKPGSGGSPSGVKGDAQQSLKTP